MFTSIKYIVPLLSYLIVESLRYLHHKYSFYIKILGLISAISYLVVILHTWIFANYLGYIYFVAGEPHLLIKYFEWVIGANSIIVLSIYLKKELAIQCSQHLNSNT